MIDPISPSAGWRAFTEPRPYVTTSGFAFDSTGRFPILFRGPKVRSARNVWSLPSGLHEVGYTLGQQFCNELHEECGLEAYPDTARVITTYENIAPDLSENAALPQWHWVITILAVKVKTLDTFINKEPDKHPETRFIQAADLYSYNREQFSGPLYDAMMANMDAVFRAAAAFTT